MPILTPKTTPALLMGAAALLLLAMLAWAGLYIGNPERIVRCGGTGSDRNALLLTDAQCHAIGNNIAILQPNAPASRNVTTFEAVDRLIRVGAPPPEGTTLASLPASVSSEFPDLAPLRYFLVEDEIALVDPERGRIVAFVEVHTQKRLGFWDWKS